CLLGASLPGWRLAAILRPDPGGTRAGCCHEDARHGPTEHTAPGAHRRRGVPSARQGNPHRISHDRAREGRTMSVRLTVQLQVQPGKANDFKAAAAPALARVK